MQRCYSHIKKLQQIVKTLSVFPVSKKRISHVDGPENIFECLYGYPILVRETSNDHYFLNIKKQKSWVLSQKGSSVDFPTPSQTSDWIIGLMFPWHA
jgi:hypothetical protein